MAEVCARCKTWRKEQYWEEYHPNKHHFFKIMLGDFRNQLRVPRKFQYEFKETLSRKVALRGPSRSIWTTDLVQRGDDFVLQNGWEIFAKDHSLHEGDFLVFQYFGESSFDVLIFDATGCEREGSYFVERNSSLCTKHCCSMRESTDLTTNTSEGPTGDVQKASTTMSESSERREESEKQTILTKKCTTSVKRRHGKVLMQGKGGPNGDSRCGTDDGDAAQSAESKKKMKKRRATGEKNGMPEDVESCDESSVKMDELVDEENQRSIPDSDARTRLTKGKRIRYLISNRRMITEKEIKTAVDRAKRHLTTQPSCEIEMQPSHVNHGFILTIPKRFADIYLPRKSEKIKLRVLPGKKTWVVQFNRRKLQCTLNKGWSEFVLDNNLETEDVCVLELVDTGTSKQKCLLDVSIFRVVEDIVHPKVF